MEPKVILVDYLDNPLGEMKKGAAHASTHLHSAFSVFLYHDGKILLQKRAENKYHCGGLWTNTCCSHPRPGEITLDAARRRLDEEMKIHVKRLEEIYSFVYYYKFDNGICEFEFDHVIMGEYYGSYKLDPKEAEAAVWMEKTELLEDMQANPQKYTPWFLTCAVEVLKRI